MKGIKIFLLVFAASAFMLTSCGDTVIEIPLGDVSLDIDLDVDETAQSSLRSDELLIPFSGSYTLDLNDPIFAPIASYVSENRNIRLVVKSVSLLINPVRQDLDFKIYDFKSQTFAGDTRLDVFELKEVAVKGPVSDALLTIFVNNLFTAVQSGQAVTISIAGKVTPDAIDETKVAIAKFLLGIVAEIDPASTDIMIPLD
ncbi:MAG: hypothetical protein LBS25_09480 [Candidatus Symbiothrix sp.]|jgi:hypothetical protein|nr:hypothetical protein [Candidatus Symbiothrix sp.]